jgi:hypothetical protein
LQKEFLKPQKNICGDDDGHFEPEEKNDLAKVQYL